MLPAIEDAWIGIFERKILLDLIFSFYVNKNSYIGPECTAVAGGGLADNEKAFKDKQFFKCQMPAKTGHSYQSQLYY